VRDASRNWPMSVISGLAAAMLIVLAGCGAAQPSNAARASGQSTPMPIGERVTPSPTVARTLPTATGSTRCGVKPLPTNWTWYQDAPYSFRIAAPPTWRTGAFEYIPDGSDALTSPSHIHVVDFFGPGSIGQATSSGKMRSDGFPPVITIEVDVGSGTRPTPYGTGVMSNWSAQTTPVCIGKTPITPYLFANDEGDVEWAAVLPAGPHGYLCEFSVASPADTATRDGMYFQTALTTFTVTP
jgi:hypothetical protein